VCGSGNVFILKYQWYSMENNTEDKIKNNLFADFKPRIFKNSSVLLHDYIPDTLIARDEQITQVKNGFIEVFTKGRPRHELIQGKSGSGKTVTALYVASQLTEMVNYRKDLELNLVTINVNCGQTETTVRILYEIIRELVKATGQPMSISKTGLARDWYFDKICDILNDNNLSLILVMDEIDKAVDPDSLLYRLSRADSLLNAGLFINVIMITNNAKFYDEGPLESRTKSSLEPLRFVFPPYDADMLTEILEQRVNEAFHPGVVDGMIIGTCAALGAQEHGDARRSVTLLRDAGRIAETRIAETRIDEIYENDVIIEQDLFDAEKNYDRQILLEELEKEPWQSKLTLISIIYQCQMRNFEGKKTLITTGDICNQYRLFAKEINEDELSNQRVSGMVTDLSTRNIITTTPINNGRYGQTREVSISFDEKGILEGLLKSDDGYRFMELIHKMWGKPIGKEPKFIARLYYEPIGRKNSIPNLTKYI
jgi:cell division control protein 6